MGGLRNTKPQLNATIERIVPGHDGYSPEVEVERIDKGYLVKITDKDGVHSFEVFNGNDGYTPVKGIDYFTNTEKNEFAEAISEGSIGTFKQQADSYTVIKQSEIDENASQKLLDYNSNHEEKIRSYNGMAEEKYNDFVTNVSTKTIAFNNNAMTKTSEATEEIGRHTDQKKNEFDQVADEKIEEITHLFEGVSFDLTARVDEDESIVFDFDMHEGGIEVLLGGGF